MEKIKIGVSACLLGQRVRFDGQHKLDSYLVGTLSRWFDFVPVCAEVELGLGIPRETLRLEGDSERPRMVTRKTRRDLTDDMEAFVSKRIQLLEKEALCGFIFKSKSPSCGMERVKVYSDSGMPSKLGRGLFAGGFMDRFPLLPVEEEGRLHDEGLREDFLESVFVLKRWREMLEVGPTVIGLQTYHQHHKYLLMAHSPSLCKELGRLIAGVGENELQEVISKYHRMMIQALRVRATAGQHINVLQHIIGYFKKQLGTDEKAEWAEIISNYGRGILPLIVPITLLNHYVRKYGESYLSEQYYLHPHPIELQLRNHVY